MGVANHYDGRCVKMKVPFLFIMPLLSFGCADTNQLPSETDVTAQVQQMVDAGGKISFPDGTYLLTETIVIRKSGTIIHCASPKTIFVFKPATPQQIHCKNDRAFTMPCEVNDPLRRQISAPISIGDVSFEVSDDVSDLNSGDWLIIDEIDKKAGDVVAVDWAQVSSTSGHTVFVQTAFRTAFANLNPWEALPGGFGSGLGFHRIEQPVEGTQFQNCTINVPDTGHITPAISVYAARNTLIENVTAISPNGQPLYSYLASGLTIRNSNGMGDKVLNEFGATTDLTLEGNTFSANTAGLGLDFGSGFFKIIDNKIPSSMNSGMYFLIGVHDGTVTGNSISFVGINNGSVNAIGILARGTQRLTVTNNSLEGGAGPNSIGISTGSWPNSTIPIPSIDNVIVPNSFGTSWTTSTSQN
jgi:hypothetical protein